MCFFLISSTVTVLRILVECVLKVPVWIFALLENLLLVLFILHLLVTFADKALKLLGPLLGRRNVLFVLPERLAAHAAFEGLDGIECKPWANFD